MSPFHRFPSDPHSTRRIIIITLLDSHTHTLRLLLDANEASSVISDNQSLLSMDSTFIHDDEEELQNTKDDSDENETGMEERVKGGIETNNSLDHVFQRQMCPTLPSKALQPHTFISGNMPGWSIPISRKILEKVRKKELDVENSVRKRKRKKDKVEEDHRSSFQTPLAPLDDPATSCKVESPLYSEKEGNVGKKNVVCVIAAWTVNRFLQFDSFQQGLSARFGNKMLSEDDLSGAYTPRIGITIVHTEVKFGGYVMPQTDQLM
ncbi:hypothetical protein Tco_0259896 [Tanacetum coccineum]